MKQKTTDVSTAKKPPKSSRTYDPGVGADGEAKPAEPEVKSRSGGDPGVGADGGTKAGKKPPWID